MTGIESFGFYPQHSHVDGVAHAGGFGHAHGHSHGGHGYGDFGHGHGYGGFPHSHGGCGGCGGGCGRCKPGCNFPPPPVHSVYCSAAPFTRQCGDQRYHKLSTGYGASIPWGFGHGAYF